MTPLKSLKHDLQRAIHRQQELDLAVTIVELCQSGAPDNIGGHRHSFAIGHLLNHFMLSRSPLAHRTIRAALAAAESSGALVSTDHPNGATYWHLPDYSLCTEEGI